MECKDKAVWVIADHTAQPYDGEKRCGQSDDNGRAYLGGQLRAAQTIQTERS